MNPIVAKRLLGTYLIAGACLMVVLVPQYAILFPFSLIAALSAIEGVLLWAQTI